MQSFAWAIKCVIVKILNVLYRIPVCYIMLTHVQGNGTENWVIYSLQEFCDFGVFNQKQKKNQHYDFF